MKNFQVKNKFGMKEKTIMIQLQMLQKLKQNKICKIIKHKI